MPTLTIINIAIEVCCSILCVVFGVCTLVIDTLKSKLNRVFIAVLFSNVALMLSDALAFYSNGRPGAHFMTLNYLGNFFCYIFSYVLIIVFSYYLYVYFSTKIKTCKTPFCVVCSVQGVAIILTVAALFNGMYFVIDEDNIYHRQNWYWLSQALGTVGMLVNALAIVRNRRCLNRGESFVLASYIILPVIAIAVQTLFYGYVAVYVASTLTLIFIYLGIQAQQGLALKEKELALAQGRVAMMLSQIQPHFLYNTLSAIEQLCKTDPPKAQAAITGFSHFLRGNMESLTHRQPMSFAQEMEHVKHYLMLEQMRFGERLRVVLDIRQEDFLIPSLTVQPLVENAIKHGISRRSAGGTVTIRTEEAPLHWQVTITDDGVGFDAEASERRGGGHVGIANVRSRLAVMCGGTLAVESRPGAGTVARISIPKEAGRA